MPWTRRLEDYTIVTLITLLIWLYAESRTLEPYRPGSLILELKAPGDELVVTGPAAPNVRVEFIGATSAISKLKSNLGGKVVVLLEAMEPGQHTLPLASLIPQAAQLADASVNVTSVEPATVTFTISRLVTRDADVLWEPEGLQLQEGYKAAPARVKITLPQDKAAELGVDGKITLRVQPPADEVKKFPAGVEKTVKARFLLPPELAGDPHVKLSESEVTLSFIIEKREDTHALEPVPVFFSGPPGELHEFEVRLHHEDRLLNDVEATGPVELLERVKKREITIVAQFQLNRDELVAGAQKGETSYPIVFPNLPPGLTVNTPKKAVRATVVKVEKPVKSN